MGDSGGGPIALLITAADLRVKVCAAAHPGGSMENTYLIGQGVIDREVLSLIPPRPCAMIVGEASGEEPGHRQKPCKVLSGDDNGVVEAGLCLGPTQMKNLC